MRLNELTNNEKSLERALNNFRKVEEENGYVTWYSANGVPHLQINMCNNVIYTITNAFKTYLSIVEKVDLELSKSKKFNPFCLNLSSFKKSLKKTPYISSEKDKLLWESIYYKHENKQPEYYKNREYFKGMFRSEKNRISYRLNEIKSVDEYLKDSTRFNDYLAEPHIQYIDKYTTAYNSEIMKAILSHQ
tara:strand:- start:1527 stop:2096 length:570 start_codon:yes stop_codon:yes gene_type:complete